MSCSRARGRGAPVCPSAQHPNCIPRRAAAGWAAFGASWRAPLQTSGNTHSRPATHLGGQLQVGQLLARLLARHRVPRRVLLEAHTLLAHVRGELGQPARLRGGGGAAAAESHATTSWHRNDGHPPCAHMVGMAARPHQVASGPPSHPPSPRSPHGTHLHVDHDPGAGGAAQLPPRGGVCDHPVALRRQLAVLLEPRLDLDHVAPADERDGTSTGRKQWLVESSISWNQI